MLGAGAEWEGGDVRRFPGGGQKILLLKKALEPLKDRENLLVLFTDRYENVWFEIFGAVFVLST